MCIRDRDKAAQTAEKTYTIAARCGVFAKSDIQPLINQGAKSADIAKSIYQAVVNQTIAGLAQGLSLIHIYRLEGTARYAAEHGYESFTSTLLASLYQDHDGIKAAAEKYARQYGVEFLYRDFRPNFRAGNQRARELGFYMQKYCGCVFSEQDRYQKQIDRDKKKFAEQA